MAFASGTATDQEDLLTQLFSFATSNGWTQDEFNTTTNVGSLHNTAGNNIFVHFGWSGAESGGPNNITMGQSLGFAGTGLTVDGHTNDSGNSRNYPIANGGSSDNLDFERRVADIGDGPFTGFHFFHDSGPDYIYVVLQFTPGIYRHFGFGEINKIGDWTGGEFVYGHVWDLDGSSDDNPTAGQHSFLLDGLATSTSSQDEFNPATVHIEGLPGQFGSPGRWGVCGNSVASAWRGVDTGGQDRHPLVGPGRGGFAVREYGWLNASLLNGFVPLIPMPLVYYSDTGTPDHHIILGHMPNIRHIQMASFSPGQAITVGSDTWRIFPGVRQRFQQDNQQETRNMGVAYLEVP